jgi:hypothetical protein
VPTEFSEQGKAERHPQTYQEERGIRFLSNQWQLKYLAAVVSKITIDFPPVLIAFSS